MVFRRVQRGEVEPVGFDFRATRHFKAHGAEQLLDALHGQRHRVQATGTALAAGQGDIQGLGLQLRLQLGLGQRLAACRQRGFDRLFGLVDGGTTGLFLVHAELGHALHQLGDLAGLAQEARLGVFQVVRGSGLIETLLRAGNDGFQVVHEGFLQWWQRGGAAWV